MIFLTALWARIWPYIAVVGGVLAGLFAVRQSGKSAARLEDAAKLNKQAAQAQQEAKNVDNKIDSMGDAAIRASASKWVRDDSASGH